MVDERRIDSLDHITVLAEKIDILIKDVEDINNRSLNPEEKEFVRLAIKREARKEAFREAVIQKTTISLLWSGIVGMALLLWTGLKDHLK